MKKIIEGFVILILLGITCLSAVHTMEISKNLDMNPIATMSMVEASFLVVTLVRMRQKKTNKNVPWFLEAMFYFCFAIVTGSNIWGLSDKPLGWLVGCIISLALLGFENILFWSTTGRNEELKTLSINDRRKILKEQIKEEKFKQEMEWMLFEAGKPDLKLIEKVRKADEERTVIEAERLPEFFELHPNVVPFKKPKQKEIFETTVTVPQGETKKQPIGFVQYDPIGRFEANEDAKEKAVQMAKLLQAELGRLPKQKELVERGISRHYASLARKTLKED